MSNKPYILVITAANSGVGKTTLIEKILPELIKQDIKVSVVKHAHHDFDVDQPGKDSYRLRKAGAYQTLIINKKRSALLTEFNDLEADFELAIKSMNQNIDLIIIEGLKTLNFPKIEVYREGISKNKLIDQDSSIIAVVSDKIFSCNKPCFDIKDLKSINQFIVNLINK